MTYNTLKAITKGLLTMDVEFPDDPSVSLGLLEMAYSELVSHAQVLSLTTLNTDKDVVRLRSGSYVIRYPRLPSDGAEELDIDNELGFAVARILASYVSEKKAAVHMSEARRLIREYNSKVYEFIDLEEQKNERKNRCN